ncbi:MAG: MBL fold metallo-hydrolase [Verrucomicrobiota bacterium]|nr:MBL fold metallo-hydrolase [Verrucomicrobiota bacterium]
MARFHNPHIRNAQRSLWHFLLWKAGYYKETKSPLPVDFSYPVQAPLFQPELPSALWVGHATFLIEIGGVHLLTDPVWSDHCSPVPIRALRRRHEPPLPLSDLPPIDYVLLSHNHYDHLDLRTVQHLRVFHPEIEWIVPAGVKRWFLRQGIERVTELAWWQTHSSSKGTVTALPAQHFSGRSLWDKNRTHWNGYLFEKNGKKFYFTGDTGYNSCDFRAIGAQFAPIDLSLIPIGTYLPKEFMAPVHCSPDEAVKIHQEVGSRLSLGMHWKTFCLSEEPMSQPPYDLFLAMQEKNLPLESFLPIEPGVQINW